MRVWFNRTFSSVYAAIALIREADLAGRFHLIYSNANAHATAARVAHEFFVEPIGMDSDAYLQWCLDFCLEHKVDIFIPGKQSTSLASQHARFEAQGTRVLSAGTTAALDLIHDKARFYAGASLPGAPVADFRVFEDVAQFDAAYAELRQLHPQLCVKPSNSVFGLGFAILDEERSSAALLLAGAEYHIGRDDFRRGLAELGVFRTMLLMEYLDGHEYSVDCVGDNGRLVAAIARKKPMKAGQGQLIDMRQDILDATAKLAADFGLNGCFNVQFREGAGRLRLLEINPRMSGGIGMACVAGPNLPYIALCGFADGFDKVAVPAVRDGIRVAELTSPVELCMTEQGIIEPSINEPAGARQRTIDLPTGKLELTVHDSAIAVDDLLGFAARANNKRGFLFLSKVLGKHWPVKPSVMTGVHARMAADVPVTDGPVVFIAMAETAVGLGQGVFEAWLRANPGREALFIYTTRYHVGAVPIIEFAEAHSHAPRQFLHMPPDPAKHALLHNAKTLVLVDDEASTGNTYRNLADACRKLNPHIERVHLACITNFMGAAATASLSDRFGLPVSMAALLSGEYYFTAGELATEGSPAQRFDPDADLGASGDFGRFGLDRALSVPQSLVAQLSADIQSGQSVLVLGTGEFMHPSYLLGAALEERGANVSVQSTTRSPILKWGSVSAALAFPDNYGEGVTNFLYNVTPGQYDHVFICHETVAGPALTQLAEVFNARLFHFLTETHVEEVSEIPVR